MTEGVNLRNRLLLWHKVLAQLTGTLSLSHGREGLKRSALTDWASRIRTVADDMQAVADGASPVLDEQGQRVLKSAGNTAPLADGAEPVKLKAPRKAIRK